MSVGGMLLDSFSYTHRDLPSLMTLTRNSRPQLETHSLRVRRKMLTIYYIFEIVEKYFLCFLVTKIIQLDLEPYY